MTGKRYTGERREQVEEKIIAGLKSGRSLTEICSDKGMPDRATVQHWQAEDAAWDAAVTRAREAGFAVLAEAALLDAYTATDAAKGRLRLDATRWYLGKLSNAFSDNKPQSHKVDLALSAEAAAWLGQEQKQG